MPTTEQLNIILESELEFGREIYRPKRVSFTEFSGECIGTIEYDPELEDFKIVPKKTEP